MCAFRRIGPGNHMPIHAQMRLQNQSVINIAAADTYQKITGDWIGELLSQFAWDSVGDKLTYQGPDGRHILFNGASNVEASKACTIAYALFLNGVLVPAAQTPHDFDTSNKTETIAISTLATLDRGDEIEVFCKADDDTADLTIHQLYMTFWGETR